jgi:uncharacterized protein (TIGR04141 family)
MKLVFSMFDETVEDFEEVFLEGKLTSAEDPYIPVPLRQENNNIQVYLQRNKRGVPAWIGFFGAHCDFHAAYPDLDPVELHSDFLVNQYNSLVVVFRVEHPKFGQRFLTLTQGMGHLAVDSSQVEDDFGLTVSMNAIDPEKVTGVDARDLGTRTQVKRLRTNFHGEVWEFDFDPDLEVVGGMTGVPSEAAFADQIAGSESVALFRTVKWSELEKICGLLLDKYASRDYENRFRFAANKRRLRNKHLISVLDAKLRDALRERNRERISLVLPIDWADQVVETEVRIPVRPRRYALAPFSAGALFRLLDDAEVEDFDAKTLTLYHFNAEGGMIRQLSLYKHLVADLELLDTNTGRVRHFVLSDGGWYSIASGHIAKVRERIGTVPVLKNHPQFPPMRWISSTASPAGHRREREDEYNERVSTAQDLALFDKVLFSQRLGGNSRIEVCDLLAADGRFYCIKKYEGSADLSHLFAQGFVSVELFLDLPEYRAFVVEKIDGKFPAPFDPGDERPNNLKIVYAIACPADFQIPEDLPFFAQATLATYIRRVRRYGFEVELAHIVVPDPPATGTPVIRRRRKKAAIS